MSTKSEGPESFIGRYVGFIKNKNPYNDDRCQFGLINGLTNNTDTFWVEVLDGPHKNFRVIRSINELILLSEAESLMLILANQ